MVAVTKPVRPWMRTRRRLTTAAVCPKSVTNRLIGNGYLQRKAVQLVRCKASSKVRYAEEDLIAEPVSVEA